MEKKQLKSLVETFECPVSGVTFNFVGELADKSALYTVTNVKTGRGKGGSKILTLVGPGGEEFVTGTSQSDFILNVITPDGMLHGYETSADVPRVFTTNAGFATKLKAQMLDYVGAVGVKIRVSDTAKEFDASSYTVTHAELMKGRYGQVKFTMQNDDDESFTSLWSYRHSGIVTELEIIETPTQDTV